MVPGQITRCLLVALYVLVPAAALADCYPAPSGLVSWWRANVDALDSVGGNDGAYVDGARSGGDGVVDRAFSFDGQLDCIAVPDNASLDFGTGDFSVTLWVRFNDLVNSSNGIIHKDNFAGTGTYKGWLLNICDGCSPGGVGIEVRNVAGSGPSAQARWATSNFVVNRWYHLGATRGGGFVRLYVDGVLRAEASEPSPIDVSNDEALRIGSLSPAAPQFLAGRIDEVQIWNRALAGEEIAAIHAAGSDGLCHEASPCIAPAAGPLSWWTGDFGANDVVGQHPGAFDGGAAACAPALVAGGFQFDGVDDRILVPDHPELDFGTGDFSVNFWVLFEDLAAQGDGLLSKDNFSGFSNPYRGWLFNVCNDCGGGGGGGNGAPGVGWETRDVSGGSGPWTHARWDLANFRAGVWCHLAGVRASNVVQLYVDGVLRATTPESSPTDVSTDEMLQFGALSAFAHQYFFGLLDEVQIHTRALSAEEVAAIYVAGNAGQCKPPVVGVPIDTRGVRLPLLAPSRPNPFSAATTITFTNPNSGRCVVSIVDVGGRVLRTVETSAAGRTDVMWDGRDAGGKVLPSGMYFVRLSSAGRTTSRTISLVR